MSNRPEIPTPHSDAHTPESLAALLRMQRNAFASDRMPDLATRHNWLTRLLAMTRKNAGAIAQAISDDFGNRSRAETFISELAALEQRIGHTRKHLASWMRMRRVPTSVQYLPASNRLLPQPLGVIGIVSPWNYPFDLSIGPAMDALAAGNRVMLKPSEIACAIAPISHDGRRLNGTRSRIQRIRVPACGHAAFSRRHS